MGMMGRAQPGIRRRLAPEVVQTSAMDCGPAALKCLLDGHGVPISYGRLREACQTSVDGTSIDAIEHVARQLGLPAEQMLLPRDFIGLDAHSQFPAIVVVRHASTATHFVVVWASHGPWLQVMDPAIGRRWISRKRFAEAIFAHEQSVPAQEWRAWCDSADWRSLLGQRLAGLGMEAGAVTAILAEAAADPGWFGFGALDAAARLAGTLADAGGLDRGAEATRVVLALFRDTLASGDDIFALIPADYWSARPDLANIDASRQMLIISGGVLMAAVADAGAMAAPVAAGLPPELAAAISEGSPRPLRRAWALLREDGAVRPGRLAVAILVQGLALLVQVALFRGLIDVAQSLALPWQRLVALGLLCLLLLLAGMLELGLAAHAIGQGRRLEIRLRLAVLRMLPRLKDRYFRSRPITDMADRSHNIQAVRGLPMLATQAVQALCEMVLTLMAIAWIAPASTGWALALVALGLGLPAMVQPALNEADLRVRNHGGALHGFYLDALLGLAPIRAHRAEAAVTGQHEGLLVDWVQAARGLARWSLGIEAVQMLLTTALAAGLLVQHFAAQRGIGGADLLLLFWTLRLPAVADRLSGLARAYPAMRNTLLRQLEPLDAPASPAPVAAPSRLANRRPAAIRISAGRVVAGGHQILDGLDLAIAAGEHVAVVGRSGAGKSSLLGLLLGWHELADGELLVDGAPLDATALAALRQQTAWVDPQVQLWNRSLLDNLAYASDADGQTRLRPALADCDLIGLTGRLPQGLQTAIGEGGGLLSGGEGQRVRLGRAHVMDAPRLVLLDEPFRGLDRGQRRHLMAKVRQHWAATSLICVTHDIAETRDFARVLVIDDGRLVEDGAPETLRVNGGRYADLLAAEQHMEGQLWQAARWRRWHVADGRVEMVA
jgi:ATP-binding cassette subfamily B protein